MANISKLPSGSYRALVRKINYTGSKTFKTRREANEWATLVEAQAQSISNDGFQTIPAGYSLAHLIDDYLLITKPTGKSKLASLRMIRKMLGHVLLKNLNAINLRNFNNDRLEQGAGGVTIGCDLSHLGSVLAYGRHARQLNISATLATDARAHLTTSGHKTRSNKRSRLPKDDEINRLYASWDANERITIPMVNICKFAIATTMRQEEICSILLDDIDIPNKTVIIRNRKDPNDKVGNDQTVPLLPAAWEIIDPILAKRKTGLVFPFNARSVSSSFTRLCAKLKIDDLHFHDLRHKGTSDLFAMGFSIPEVQVFTGHKSWDMLKVYTHLKSSDIHDTFTHLSQTRVQFTMQQKE